MRARDRSGVTLIELMVVTLMVVVMAIALTPLLGDYIVRVNYSVEALPAVGDIKTRLLAFQSEHGFLPGVPRSALNDPLTNATSIAGASQLGANNNHTASTLGAGIPLQTFLRTTTDDGPPVYHPAQVITFEHGKGSVQTVLDIMNVSAAEIKRMPFHFSDDLGINPADYSSKRLRPNHIFYRTDAAGAGQDGFLYVIGVFGNGDGLPTGTGYAIMELHNPVYGQKFTATWQRYRTVRPDARQIGILNSAESIAVGLGSSTEWKRENVCWIGDVQILMNREPTAINQAAFREMLLALRDAGWEF